MANVRQIAILLLALLAALLGGASLAQAQTITNTAAATWTDQGHAFATASNTVAFSVQQSAATIDTYQLFPDGSQALTFSPSLCGGNPIVFNGSTSPATVSSLEKSGSVRIGDVLIFRLVDAASNLDPGVIDSTTATLVTTAGDREVLTVYETGANTGVFIAAIQTSSIPPQPQHGDCRLSVAAGDHVSIECSKTGNQVPIATADIVVLADPFGLVFDSADGSPVSGARVTLVDAQSGAPARVFGDDGTTPWPSSVISGSPIIDGAGQSHAMLPGEYRFPFTPLGSYRLVIEPPAPYAAPSAATYADLAALRRPDGLPFTIIPASFGKPLTLTGPAAVRVDVPLDRPALAVALTKTASRATALPGDVVFYKVTVQNADARSPQRRVVLVDRPGSQLRLRAGSVRVDGVAAPASVTVSPDGRTLSVALGTVAPGASRTVSYAMTIRANANAGQAINVATATDARGISATTSATVRIEREDLAARTTLVGRVIAGTCSAERGAPGVPGVRVVLEDGSFAVTDADGRYHFAGLVPGSHVVQALTSTLPAGGQFVDCTRSTRSAGSASSRFVIGQGGEVLVADFYAQVTLDPADNNLQNSDKTSEKDEVSAQRTAAGADIDWLTLGDGPTDFLFPAADHNPRAPAVRVAIRHRVTEKIELLVDGKAVDPVAFEGTRSAPGGRYSVSLWRGIPLNGEVTRLKAVVRSERGAQLQVLEREVHFAATPARVELLPAQSRLIADGVTRPVLALRVLDRTGRPVHAGLSGEFALGAPYESAEALDAMQSRALSGLGRAAPRWLVRGDDGIAYVELAPTMASGKLHMEFTFADAQQRRRQELDAWVVPGQQPWTVVGLGEGTLGARDVADTMEHTGSFDSDLGRRARVAVYAKGPIAKSLLMTVAYDSAKQRDDQRLMGAIDPRAYYTVFADGSDRRFDAASREKLYARIEGKHATALYGDFETGFDQVQLARYARTATGLRGEVSTGAFHAAGFAARIASTHRRDEFQGGGISGPYRLSSRAIISGSESVAIEVRDRFRSEVIVSRRSLIRFIDYDLDVLAGTITFKEPLLSRDADLNPQFAVIDFELDDTATGGQINAGLRADITGAGGAIRIGASAITDTSANGNSRTTLGAIDLRARIAANTELRAEAGMSGNDGEGALAWLVEAEHHSSKLDVLAYARYAEREFGLGQTSGAERGRRKLGLDARYQLTEAFSYSVSAWDDASLTDATHRTALQLGALYRTQRSDARIGITTMQDTLGDSQRAGSTVLEGGVTQRLLDNRLEVAAASSIALDQAESLDLPERHRLTLRYAVKSDLRLVGSYELARGKTVNARTARAGFELSPWQGARLTSNVGQQDIAEYGKRSFAAFGLAQSLDLSKRLTIDATLDGSRTLGNFDASHLVNAAHPAASGGLLSEAGTLTEDFTALTLGGTWRDGRWSLTGRGEWRDGEQVDNKGLTLGAIRQLGEGTMLGGAFSWTRADAAAGAATNSINAALALAHRPAKSNIAVLAKGELRADRVTNATAGEAGPIGGAVLTVSGDARSTRVIGSVSLDWSPRDRDGDAFVQRSEVSLFGAVRHNFDRVEGLDLAGTTLIGGFDARYGVTEKFDIGARGSVRAALSEGATNFSFGPEIGFSPSKDVLLVAGYNVTGYRDRDFSAAHNTNRGIYASVRFKLDAGTFSFLGIDR